jgi:hypothetical protein
MTAPTAPFAGRDQLQRWNQALLSGDAWRIATIARELAEASAAVDTNFKFTLCDKFWKPMGELGGWLMENTGTDPRNDCPTSKMVLQGKTPFFDAFMDCRNTMVGVIIETAGSRFPFYVKTFTEHYEKAETTGIAELRGIWDILNYFIIWPTWFLPIQAQPFSHAVFLWALETVLQTMVAECAVRIQSGWLEFVNNALSLNPDIRAWFGAIRLALKRDGLSEGTFSRMLRTPLYVQRVNPFLDTSPLVARTVRMESCGTVIKDITKAYGVDTRVDLWLPGDEQPDRWANLDSPTYVFKTADRSQIQGPTKTVLDSVLRTVVDIEGSLLGRLLDPLLNPSGPNPALPEGAFEAERLGVNFVAPYAIAVAPDPGQDGNIISADISHHTPDGWQHIIGGRSPKWAGAHQVSRLGGHQPTGLSLTKRSHQRNNCLADRLHNDRGRIHRHTKRSARRVPEQLVPGVPAHRVVQPPQRRRPLPSGDRNLHGYSKCAVQRRDAIRLHQQDLGYKGLHRGDREDRPIPRPLCARSRHLQRWPDVAGVPQPNEDVHRLCRERNLENYPYRAVTARADRRREAGRGAARETSALGHFDF